jgi:hypothetical protein
LPDRHQFATPVAKNVASPACFHFSVSGELKSARKLIANTLFLGHEPVWQDIFGSECKWRAVKSRIRGIYLGKRRRFGFGKLGLSGPRCARTTMFLVVHREHESFREKSSFPLLNRLFL